MKPPNEEITNEEAIRALSDMTESHETSNSTKGACIYIAGAKTYSAKLTEAQADQQGNDNYSNPAINRLIEESNHGYFSKRFKEMFGKCPLDWRVYTNA
jgi:hypothetical protein